MTTLFYKNTKIFDKLLKPLGFYFFFISGYLLAHCLYKKKSSWLIFESMKDLEISTSMQYYFSSLFFAFLIIDLYFLIPVIAELVIPTGIPNKEAKAEIEIHPVTAVAKIIKWSM